MTGRSGSGPLGQGQGRTSNNVQVRIREHSATSQNAPYSYDDDVLADDEDEDGEVDPFSSHIENTSPTPTSQYPRYVPPPRYYQQQYARDRQGYDPRLTATLSTPIPHAQDSMTYESSSENDPPSYIRRGIAREPRVHISPIAEELESVAFPYTIQGPGHRIVRPLPLPPVPARTCQQGQGNQRPVAQRVQSRSLPQLEEEDGYEEESEQERKGSKSKGKRKKGKSIESFAWWR